MPMGAAGCGFSGFVASNGEHVRMLHPPSAPLRALLSLWAFQQRLTAIEAAIIPPAKLEPIPLTDSQMGAQNLGKTQVEEFFAPDPAAGAATLAISTWLTSAAAAQGIATPGVPLASRLLIDGVRDDRHSASATVQWLQHTLFPVQKRLDGGATGVSGATGTAAAIGTAAHAAAQAQHALAVAQGASNIAAAAAASASRFWFTYYFLRGLNGSAIEAVRVGALPVPSEIDTATMVKYLEGRAGKYPASAVVRSVRHAGEYVGDVFVVPRLLSTREDRQRMLGMNRKVWCHLTVKFFSGTATDEDPHFGAGASMLVGSLHAPLLKVMGATNRPLLEVKRMGVDSTLELEALPAFAALFQSWRLLQQQRRDAKQREVEAAAARAAKVKPATAALFGATASSLPPIVRSPAATPSKKSATSNAAAASSSSPTP
jgi:hypothetical protein